MKQTFFAILVSFAAAVSPVEAQAQKIDTGMTGIDQVIEFEYTPPKTSNVKMQEYKTGLGAVIEFEYKGLAGDVIVWEYKDLDTVIVFEYLPNDQVIVYEYKGLDAEPIVFEYKPGK